MRRGFTTGTCAAAAAYGAAALALGLVDSLETVELTVPGGVTLKLPVKMEKRSQGTALCGVQKDSGDDPDVTNGAWIYAEVTLNGDEQGRITIDGGLGVGRVTKPGLACAVGEAAINPTPRAMIREQVERARGEAGYEGGISVEISIPAGQELAKRTYNPRLGIVGGISVLGTTGIVEPMSEQALMDTIKVEIDMQKAAGAKYLLMTPGNYGERYLKEMHKLKQVYSVRCSNFFGETVDYAAAQGFEGLLLVAHIGKLVKVAGGIMNTHSRYGDGRIEILAAHGARMGASQETVQRLFHCVTTDDAIAVLDDSSVELRNKTIESVLERVDFHIKERTGGALLTGAVMFSNVYGFLGQTANAAELIGKLER